MCTKPGVFFYLIQMNHFLRHIKEAVKSQEVFPMLNQSVYKITNQALIDEIISPY